MTNWMSVRATVSVTYERTHEIKVDRDEYMQWLGSTKPSSRMLREYITSDSDWTEDFHPGSLIDDDLLYFELEEAQELTTE